MADIKDIMGIKGSAKAPAAKKTKGSTLNVTSPSCQFMLSIAPTMNVSVKRSPKTVTTPELKSSLSVSTSLVMRVMRRPIGFLS